MAEWVGNPLNHITVPVEKRKQQTNKTPFYLVGEKVQVNPNIP